MYLKQSLHLEKRSRQKQNKKAEKYGKFDFYEFKGGGGEVHTFPVFFASLKLGQLKSLLMLGKIAIWCGPIM